MFEKLPWGALTAVNYCPSNGFYGTTQRNTCSWYAVKHVDLKGNSVILELLWLGEGFPGMTIYGMPGAGTFIAAVTDPDDADAIEAMFDYVGTHGPPRIKSKCRPLSTKIFELKPGAVRLPFFYDETRRATIIITHGFMKQSQKTPRHEREFAERQRDSYLVELKRATIYYDQ